VTDFGRSFSYPFRDPAWLRRVVVGGLLEVFPLFLALPAILNLVRHRHVPAPRTIVLLPLVIVVGLAARFVVLGYLRRVAKGVLDGTGEGLPPWDRFADDLVEGFKLWLVAFGLWLPAVAVVAGLTVLVMSLASPMFAWLPIVLVGPPALLLTLAYMPAGLLTTVAEDELAAAFDLDRVGRLITRTFGPYALAFLVAIAAEIVAQLGLVFCCVGIFATRFIAHCVGVHAFASVYREGATALPAPATVLPSALP
jgi:hypothetical protein